MSNLDKSVELGICYDINRITTMIRLSVLQALMASPFKDITLEQYEVLFVLLKNNGVYQRQLAKLLLKDRPNVTRMLSILEEKKFIRREQQASNKKVIYVYITDLGLERVKEVAIIKNKQVQQILKNFTENELAQFTGLVDKMKSNLANLFTIQT
ncbi:MAG: MarR family transcriptional regulator [Candidatus Gastranaerophilales bacterium]|nr:MarR family transcriptional regulator [Candidatus Gastranaerophilales bacterium]